MLIDKTVSIIKSNYWANFTSYVNYDIINLLNPEGFNNAHPIISAILMARNGRSFQNV